jgi:hypothetical protein
MTGGKSLRVVLTCGHPHSGYRVAHDALVSVGLAQALPSHHDAITTEILYEEIFGSQDLTSFTQCIAQQVHPGITQQRLAADLFIKNASQHSWGWADSRSTWLLEFWRDFDRDVRFVLVYSPPELVVAAMLPSRSITTESVQAAVRSWTVSNSEILRFYYRNSGRCLLVNSHTVEQAKDVFVRQAIDCFDLKLGNLPAEHEIGRGKDGLIAGVLAKKLIAEEHQALALYEELESAASFGGVSSKLEAEGKREWQEYLDLLCSLREFDRRNRELSAEKEALLVDSRRIAGEYEQHLLKHKEAESLQKPEIAHALAISRVWRNQVTEVVVDMRREIDGENWYYPEHDGRWGGPDRVSVVRMPALADGPYELQLEVVDAMERSILYGLELSLNGTALGISRDWRRYPATIRGTFSAPVPTGGAVWEFRFGFPKTMSPALRGSQDTRQLSIRLRSIKLLARA